MVECNTNKSKEVLNNKQIKYECIQNERRRSVNENEELKLGFTPQEKKIIGNYNLSPRDDDPLVKIHKIDSKDKELLQGKELLVARGEMLILSDTSSLSESPSPIKNGNNIYIYIYIILFVIA